ncbi:NHL repeat-containing protein [Paenibacillus sp. N3.4]|uniref:NHL repeat-containing protein n=1 Tax=Paenibacillus sp. N3.4 TaxID=2603222 RepID=UPI0011CA1ADD|nr:NHL repeat-containing protein [Paenibacillus sp. N3.4]TXK70081.1 hypothetical protein FU659_33890 [Paenibacillus sp. N3.4]
MKRVHARKCKELVVSLVILMMFATAFAAPTQAAVQWSQYAKIGLGSNDGPGAFEGPADIVVDSDSNVYVADSVNHRIQKLTVATGVWSEWKKSGGGYGSGLGEFSNPVSVAVYQSDKIYVADSSNHRIQQLDVHTGVWSEWKKSGGGPGSLLGEFSDPQGVDVDKSGNVYVADSRNHRIQKLDIVSARGESGKRVAADREAERASSTIRKALP